MYHKGKRTFWMQGYDMFLSCSYGGEQRCLCIRFTLVKNERLQLPGNNATCAMCHIIKINCCREGKASSRTHSWQSVKQQCINL